MLIVLRAVLSGACGPRLSQDSRAYEELSCMVARPMGGTCDVWAFGISFFYSFNQCCPRDTGPQWAVPCSSEVRSAMCHRGGGDSTRHVI